MFYFIDIYSFIPVNGCALLCQGVYYVVKRDWTIFFILIAIVETLSTMKC